MALTAFRAARWRAVAVLVLSAFGACGAPMFGLALKWLADASFTGDRAGVLQASLVMGAALGAAHVSSTIATGPLRMSVEEQTRLYIERHVITLSSGLPGIAHHEQPEFANKVAAVAAGQGQLAQPVGPFLNLATTLLGGVTTVLLLGHVHSLLVLLPLAGVPSLAAAVKGARLVNRASDATIESSRKAYILFWIATNVRTAKEVRIFGLAPELRRRLAEVNNGIRSTRVTAGLHSATLSAGAALVFGLGYAAAVAHTVWRAGLGHATPGDVLLTVSLAAQVNGTVAQLARVLASHVVTMRTVTHYLWLVDYAARARAEMSRGAGLAAPTALRRGIRFDRVSFRYPGADTDALVDVTVELPAGSVVAIVGENGAGKSTLVKLLCRFYDPTGGHILVDDTDLRDLDVATWRDKMSAGFQDFAQLQFIARESIGVGHLASMADDRLVREALERAHARDVLDDLPRGLHTQLGRQFEQGVELSGGQWQKVALGRAMMRADPLVRVLDEPTAALDALTEHALLDGYTRGAAAAAANGRDGAITVIVSHRFSTVRLADVIVVMAEGRVDEVGTHDELVAAGGTYATLYALQARALIGDAGVPVPDTSSALT